MSLQNRTISISPAEIDNIVDEELDDDGERSMEERVAAAKETCRQRRIATYMMLTLYFIFAIYYLRHRSQKET